MDAILHTFGVNGGQLILNTINFLLLTVLLTVFAYRPALKILEKRRAMIAKSVEDAQTIEKERVAMQEEYKKALHEANNESKKIIEQAVTQGGLIAQKIQDEAKVDATNIVEKAKIEISQEKQHMYDELSTQVRVLVANAMKEVLMDSLSTQEQEALIQKTVEKLRA